MSNDFEFATSDVANNEHDEPGPSTEGAARPAGIWHTLLAPQTLQILMLSGGGLLVLGLVIWLWAQGVFENSLITAVTLGAVNLGVLGLGVAGVRRSRYQTAGMALTILGCLVLPLNLWFYDAQGLVTLDQGGHLWVAALVCCSLYVGVASVLANSVFIYPIVGGVAMTGLLFLADQQIGRFWEITAPSALLMVIGMICIHAERLFPIIESPFSRDKFGKAFFRAGHITLAVGMLILICGHIVGWIYEPIFAQFGWFPLPAVATQTDLKMIALGLSLAAAYSYIYSQVVAAERGRYAASALATLVWCGLIAMDLLGIPFTMEVAAMIAAVSALLANLPSLLVVDKSSDSSIHANRFGKWISDADIENVASWLNFVASFLVFGLYLRARLAPSYLISPYQFSIYFVIASLLAVASTWLASRRPTAIPRQLQYSVIAILAVLSIAGILGTTGHAFGPYTMVAEMIAPLAITVFALTSKKVEDRSKWAVAAESAAAILLAVGCGVATGLVRSAATPSEHVWLLAFFAEAIMCFGLTIRNRFRTSSAVGAALSLCGFAWQLLLAVGVTRYEFLYASLLVGLAGAVTSRIVGESSPMKAIALWTTRICLSYGCTATLLLGTARILTSESHWGVVGLLASYFTATAVAASLSADSKWRKNFAVMAGLQLVLMLFTIGALSTLHFVQRLELLVAAGGAFLFVAGLTGWRREGERRDPLVSCNLDLGSVLSVGPLLLGLVMQRLGMGWNDWGWIMFHELGVLVIGLALLGIGMLCRFRWSTLTGAASLATYVLSLVLLIRIPDQLQTTAIYMMVGGGLFFTTAVLLSIYRDRLLAFSQKVQSREGVFEVLTWS